MNIMEDSAVLEEPSVESTEGEPCSAIRSFRQREQPADKSGANPAELRGNRLFLPDLTNERGRRRNS